MEKTKFAKRIPYQNWTNSQLSIAKFYGGCILEGKRYVLDYDNCKTTGEGKDKKYFPDLVLESELKIK